MTPILLKAIRSRRPFALACAWIAILGLLAPDTSAVETAGWEQITDPTRFTCMLPEDSLLWVGTDAGLIRINPATGTGTRFTTANSGLADNEITALARSRKGTLWIGTRKGLDQLLDGRWTFHDYSNSPVARGYGWETVLSLAVDNLDNLWVGMRGTNSHLNLEGGGLHYFNGIWKKNVLPEKGGAEVAAIAADSNGTVWFTETRMQYGWPTEGGVFAASSSTADIDNSIRARVFTAQKNPTSRLGLYPDRKGFFWNKFTLDYVQWGGDFYKPVPIPVAETSGEDPKAQLTTDKEGRAWLWGEGKIYRRQDTGWVVIMTLPDSLNLAQGVKEIRVDESDRVYLRTDSALYWQRGSGWLAFKNARPLVPWPWATCMTIDTSGRKFVGSTDGLYYESGAAWSRFDMSNSGLPSNNIGWIGLSPQGSLWILSAPDANPATAADPSAFRYAHLTRYVGGVWKTFRDADGFPASLLISGIAFTPGGDLWVATQKGLYRWNGAFWSAYRTNQDFQSIATDKSGGVHAGFRQLDKGHVLRLDAANGSFLSDILVSINDITDLVCDGSGSLWSYGRWSAYGFSRDYGFVHRSQAGTTLFEHKAPGDYPYYDAQALTSDQGGGMWMSARYINRNASEEWRSNKLRSGIVRPLNLPDFGHRHGLFRYAGGSWTEYTSKSSGLQREEITAMAAAQDGTMWFASATGLSSFRPPTPVATRIPGSPVAFPIDGLVRSGSGFSWRSSSPGTVRIEQILLDGRTRKVLLSGHLPAGQHELAQAEGSGIPILRIEAGGKVRYSSMAGGIDAH